MAAPVAIRPARGHAPEELLGRLHNVRQSGPGRWVASCPCPGHRNGDEHPSLHVQRGDMVATLTSCRSQRHSYAEVLAALGLGHGARLPSPARTSDPIKAAVADVLARERQRHVRLAPAFAACRLADCVRLARRLAGEAQGLATAGGPDHPDAWPLVGYAARLEVQALTGEAVLDAVDVRPSPAGRWPR